MSLKKRSFAILLGMLLAVTCAAQGHGDRKSTKVADSWLGHDASELLTQWPVDRGFTTYEVPETGETAYAYSFGSEAYSYENSYQEAVGAEANGNVIVENRSEHVDVPAEHHCSVVFYANAEGIISRYDYDGVKCRPYMASWGRPKQ